MDNYVPVYAWIFSEERPMKGESQWKPLQRHSPEKAPWSSLEWRPQSKRLFRQRKSTLWQPREMALKRHSHRAPGGGPTPRDPAGPLPSDRGMEWVTWWGQSGGSRSAIQLQRQTSQCLRRLLQVLQSQEQIRGAKLTLCRGDIGWAEFIV